jgi:hypothetical protein
MTRLNAIPTISTIAVDVDDHAVRTTPGHPFFTASG